MPLFIALMVGNERLYSLGKLFEVYGYLAVPPESQHLTLIFIGDVDSYRSYLLKQRLSSMLFKHSRFIEVTGLELLPQHKATNIAVTVKVPSDVLNIREKLLEEVREVVEPRDRYSFYPHVTIARRPRPASENILNEVLETMGKIKGRLPKLLHVKGLALVYSRAGRYRVELWLSEPLTGEC